METSSEINKQRKKIHPHKFALWVAMGSIIMMFAGFTSAFIVKRNQANWQGFELPIIFTYSTAVIIVSSITAQACLYYFKRHQMKLHRLCLCLTAALGVIFLLMQWQGFVAVNNGGIKLIGAGSNVAASFLAVIAGMHMLHIIGGVVVILIILAKALFARSTRSYNVIPIEIITSYWHFVGILWIYLFIFMSTVN